MVNYITDMVLLQGVNSIWFHKVMASSLKKEIVMAINRTAPGVAYGLSDALLDVFPAPVVSTRDPLASDKAQLGTVWVNKSTNDFFILTSIVANVATWSSPSNGSGIFTSLEATTGNITADIGDIVATLGSVTAGAAVSAGTNVSATLAISAGTTITAGTGITATTGDITASAGDIVATVGDLSIGGAAAITGNLTVSSGDIVATAGNVVVTLGDLTVAAGDITATAGDIEASVGAVRGAQAEASGDLGGVVSVTSLTNVTNTTQGAGALSILSTTGNPGNNAGFIKIYVGSTTAYVPYFTNIAP